MSETIAKIRHQHYEEKRKGKLELLERSLKNGLLADLITNKSTMSPNKSYLSSYPLQNHSRLINQSPPSHGAGTRTLPLSPQAHMSAEIPLKHPIDIEFKLNRKLARQLYEQEMLNKVHLNKEQKDALREEINAQRLKKEMEK